MSTIKSSAEHLTLNADGSGKEIKFQCNGTEVAKIDSTGFVNAGATSLNGLSDATTSATSNLGLGANAVDSITTGDYNVGVGDEALTANTSAEYNVAIGYQAGKAITTGSYNTAIGTMAFKEATTAARNVAIGVSAGQNITDSEHNTAVGTNALSQNTTADYNTAVGSAAMTANTTGQKNSAVGRNALGSNTTGDENVAVGRNAGWNNTTSSKNTFVGDQSGYNNTTGYGNTFLGHKAYYGNTTGNHNVAVGHDSAHYSQGRPITGSENTYVGARTNSGVEAQGNQIVLGFEGRPSHSSSTSHANFHHGHGTYSKIQLGQTSISGSSDERLKKDIADSTAGLDFINDLKPRTFKFKKQKDILPTTLASYKEGSETIAQGGDASTFYGFVAQEIKTAIDAHNIIDNGHIWEEAIDGCQNVAQGALIPMLVKAIQELSTRVKELEDA